ncbi:MAG: hypothetical protein COA86_07570 [Kangiella sp.]|nr:MAG: hypothetical protein COA86_07570 [Kangiella sp.]
MDYELEYDYMGYPCAKFSMGHEAFGRWFTEELSKDIVLVDKILSSISQIENNTLIEKTFRGKVFELTIEIEQASVRALSLDYDSEEELGDNLELFDQELMSDCGLTDFQEALISWREFIT